MSEIWREKLNVRFGSVDRSDRLTLWSIFDFFQEAAISHATALGLGREDMASSGQAWILARLSLFVERRPAYGEVIEVSTWPRGGEKLFAYRDYAIRDTEGNSLVRGRASWLVLDTVKRRPLRPLAALEKPLPLNEGIDAFPAGAPGLNVREDLSKNGERTAFYSDIDFLGHMNNARYIQWIQDATDMDILTKASQIRLDINYLSEVMPGNTVEIWAAPLDSASLIPGDNISDYPAKPKAGFAYEGRRTEGEEQSSPPVVFRAELHC
jgi:acyl-ACP thioesterase